MKISSKSPKANEKVKLLQAELGRLHHENQRLLAFETTARPLVVALLSPCSKCHLPLGCMKWNRETFILACNNLQCSGFRVPIMALKTELVSQLGIILPSTERQEAVPFKVKH